MKIAVSSYSFAQAIRSGKMALMDVIPKAKEMGFDAVEIVRGPETDQEMKELASKLAEQSKEYEIPIVAYLVGADFVKNGLEEEVSRLKTEAEIAALMGTNRMRHDTTSGLDADSNPVESFEAVLPMLVEGCRRVAEYAAGLGVHTMSENHGFFVQESARVKKLVDMVAHKNYGWLVDIGNFLCADEDPLHAVNVGADYAVHAHVKDFHFLPADQPKPDGWFSTRGGNHLCGAIVGEGIVPVKECLERLKRAGYDGYVSVEFEGPEGCIEALGKGLRNLKQFLAEI